MPAPMHVLLDDERPVDAGLRSPLLVHLLDWSRATLEQSPKMQTTEREQEGQQESLWANIRRRRRRPVAAAAAAVAPRLGSYTSAAGTLRPLLTPLGTLVCSCSCSLFWGQSPARPCRLAQISFFGTIDQSSSFKVDKAYLLVLEKVGVSQPTRSTTSLYQCNSAAAESPPPPSLFLYGGAGMGMGVEQPASQKR